MPESLPSPLSWTESNTAYVVTYDVTQNGQSLSVDPTAACQGQSMSPEARHLSQSPNFQKEAPAQISSPLPLKPLWKAWILEISCLLISLLVLIAIILILLSYDQQPLPAWPLGTTLNTFLALFTTLTKATLMVPVLRDRDGNEIIPTAYNVSGQAWVQEPYVDIRWGWMSFLTVELALAALFLTVTIMSQRQRSNDHESNEANLNIFQDLKDSSIARMMVLGDECRALLGGKLSANDVMKAKAKETKVKLDGAEVVYLESMERKKKPLMLSLLTKRPFNARK
ncbi:hypothetical protein HJFPF1_00042 [Paramyrothecium foliicola]|nr:hypothetical protein HJFPF1_00042 [Paramyrothecium foliicola]